MSRSWQAKPCRRAKPTPGHVGHDLVDLDAEVGAAVQHGAAPGLVQQRRAQPPPARRRVHVQLQVGEVGVVGQVQREQRDRVADPEQLAEVLGLLADLRGTG